MLRKILLGKRPNPYIKYTNGAVSKYVLKTKTLSGNENVNTNFKPFNGGNWELHLIAYFPSSENQRMATILNAMDESNTNYNGFCIRKSSSSQTKIYYGESSAALSDTDDLDVTIRYVDGTITVLYGEESLSFEANYNVENLTILIGSSIDNPANGTYYRYAIATIKHFSIKSL